MTALAILVKNWKLIGIAVLFLIVFALIAINTRVSSERDSLRIELQASEQEVHALKNDMAAKEQASIERAADMAAITTNQEERDNAIATAPPSATGAATRKLNCVRWTRQHPNSPKPAGC